MLRTTLPFALLLLAFAAPSAQAGDAPPQRPEAFLWDWVRGKARFELYTEFHEWASDWNRRGTEQLEVAIKALSLREADGPERATLVHRLIDRWRSAQLDTEARRRVIHVLGRMAHADSLPLLIDASRRGPREIRKEALEALGFFGNVASEALFQVYGGRFWIVAFPPAPEPRATDALISTLRAHRATRVPQSDPSLPALERSRARRRWREEFRRLDYPILHALASHRHARVVRELLATLETPGEMRPAPIRQRDLLARQAHTLGPAVVLREFSGLGASPGTHTHVTMIAALGRCRRREAVAPLIALCSHEAPPVSSAAHDALMALTGASTLSPRLTPDEYKARLGANGERLDVKAAPGPRVALAPGIYKLGR